MDLEQNAWNVSCTILGDYCGRDGSNVRRSINAACSRSHALTSLVGLRRARFAKSVHGSRDVGVHDDENVAVDVGEQRGEPWGKCWRGRLVRHLRTSGGGDDCLN